MARPKKTQADHRIRSATDRQRFHHRRHSFGHETSDASQFLPSHKRTSGSPSVFSLRAGDSPVRQGNRLNTIYHYHPLPPITAALPITITTHYHPLPRTTTHYHALPTHYHPLPPTTKKASTTELSRIPRGAGLILNSVYHLPPPSPRPPGPISPNRGVTLRSKTANPQ